MAPDAVRTQVARSDGGTVPAEAAVTAFDSSQGRQFVVLARDIGDRDEAKRITR